MTGDASVRPAFRLQLWTLVYIFWSLVAAAIAIARELPAAFSGISTGLTASRDFFYGIGTALSPPLIWLCLLAYLGWRVGRSRTLSRRRAIALGVLLFLNAIGAIGEPITLELIAAPDPVLVVVQLGMILIPLLGAWVALGLVRQRPA